MDNGFDVELVKTSGWILALTSGWTLSIDQDICCFNIIIIMHDKKSWRK